MRRWPSVGLAALSIVTIACGTAPAAAPASQPAQQPAAPAAQPAAAPSAQPASPAQPAQTAAQPTQAAAAAAAPKPAASGSKQRILFGSSASGTAFYIYGVALTKLWNAKASDVDITVTETGGGLDNIKRIDSGDFLAGFSPTDLTYQAWHGLEDFKGKAIQAQRYLYILGPAPSSFVVRRDSIITKFEDLEGKDWSPGQKGSAAEKHTMNIMAAFGIKPKYYIGGAQDMVEAMKDKRILGFVRPQASAKGIDAATREVNVAVPLRSLSFNSEQEKIVSEKFPYIFFMTVEKDQLAQGFPDQTVRTIGIAVGTSAHKNMSEDLAYRLTKLAIEDNSPNGAGEQASAYPAVKGVDFVQATLDYAATPLHPGAIKYFRELGKEPKAAQIPPELK